MSNKNNQIDNEDIVRKEPRRPAKSRIPRNPLNDEKIDRQLTNIYKDDNGQIPDMMNIKKEKDGSFIGGVFKFMLVVASLAALAWAGFFFLPSVKKFSNSHVSLDITGPKTFIVGATTTYQITFKNNQDVDLNKATLSINYPSGFKYSESSIEPTNIGKNEWYVGTIKPNEEKIIQITGNSYGSIGTEESWRVLLNYTPQNFQSELQKIVTLNVSADQAPLSISLSGLDKVALDTTSTYTISLESKEDLLNKNFKIVPIFPKNFSIATSSPTLTKNAWVVSSDNITTSSVNKYLITFAGKFSASDENTVPLKVQVKMSGTDFLLGESMINIQLLKNSVNLVTAINGSLGDLNSRPGETLNFTVALKNSSQQISKAQIKLTIEAPSYNKQSVLDFANIVDKNDGDLTGSQISDSIRKATMIWNETKIKSLAQIKSGSENTFDFQLPIKDSEKLSWQDINQYQIKITSELKYIDSTKTEQTVIGNPINIILNSDLSLQVKNEVTNDKYDMTWILNNTFHSLKNVILTADVYGDITWIGPTTAPAGSIQYDTNTKRITWKIPEITENTDVLALPYSIIINKKNPTQNTLISKVRVQAEDTATGKLIDFQVDEIPLK